MKDTSFCHKLRLPSIGNLRQDSPLVMGIINCTPDSFYDDSRSAGMDESLRMAERMIEEGVDILDIGAYSSRPGANSVELEDELQRLIPSVQAIAERFPEAVISVDTFRSEVALQSIKAGAKIINDISAGNLDSDMLKVVAEKKASYVMMHMRGNAQTMMDDTHYDDVIPELFSFFQERISRAQSAGVESLTIDPGFGFSKTLQQNYQLLSGLQEFKKLGYPLLIGISRKSMIYKLLRKTPEEVLSATSGLHMLALAKGADILRVHDVKEAKELIDISRELVVWVNEDLEA